MSDSNGSKLPPQRIDLERETIGAMLIDEWCIDDVAEQVDADDFYRDKHTQIAKCIFERRANNQRVNIGTISEDLIANGMTETDAIDLLHDLATCVAHSANAISNAAIIHDKAQLRRAIEAAQTIIRDAYKAEKTPEAIISQGGQSFIDLEQGRVFDRPVEIAEFVPRVMHRVHQRNSGQVFGVPTGYTDLDFKIGGGLALGTVTIIAGRTSMGKSALAMNICENVSGNKDQPRASLVFSLEMNALDLTERSLAGHSRIDGNKLKFPKMMEKEDWGRIDRGASLIKRMPLAIFERSDITLAQIAAVARRDKAARDTAVIVIDYLSLIDSGDNDDRKARHEVVQKMSRRCHNLAKSLDVPIILVCQLNRGPENREDKRPRMSDLRESGAIEQDADLILLLNRPDYYKPEDQPGIAECFVAKNRNGATGLVKFAFLKTMTRFESVDETSIPLEDFGQPTH